jgi:HAD superfamily phosphatase (TIGR01668 family)
MKYFSKTHKKGNHQPDYVASSVDDIDYDLLASKGIVCVAFDIDGTLTRNGSEKIELKLAASIAKKLDKAGIKKRYIASNSHRSLNKIAKSLGAFEIHQPSGLKGKPSKAYYDELIEKSNCKPEQIAMIGDRLLQDIWGAKKSGLNTVLVALHPSYSTFRDKIILRQWWQPKFVHGKIEKISNKTVIFRNPVYVIYALVSIGLFVLTALIAKRIGLVETSFFRSINELPDWMIYFFATISFFGTIWFALGLSLYRLLRRQYEASLKFLLAGLGAYVASYGLGLLELRSKPSDLLESVTVREDVFSTFGFPSVHVAVATAIAIVSYQYVPKKYHRYITFSVFLVALSRMYLGFHLPIDLIGGFAVGLAVGSIVSLALGRRITSRVTTDEVMQALQGKSLPVKKVEVLGVDARGSSPFMITGLNDKKYFLKVVNKDNFFADWLFKMWRKVIYKRLEDETPFLSPKRQIEHESYVASLAYMNVIKTPKIVGVFEIKENNWGQAQEAINGKSLDKVDASKITNKLIDKTFMLVADLHKLGIIHRDLRSANIFVDVDNEPWLIDF